MPPRVNLKIRKAPADNTDVVFGGLKADLVELWALVQPRPNLELEAET